MNRKPLTSEEKSFLFEWALCPKSSAYNMNLQFELEGRVQVTTLRKALYDLTEKYEILRSIFDSKTEKRLVFKNYKADLKIVDLNKTFKLKKNLLLSEFFSQPFYLTTIPPSRYMLIKIKKEKYIFALSWHHIIVDAFAVQILLKDLEIFYNDRIQKCSNTIPTSSSGRLNNNLEIEQIDNNDFSEQVLNYWYKYLINKQTHINIRAFIDKNKIGERHCFVLEKKLSNKIMRLIGSTQSTLFTTLSAIFNILFYYYANQSQITLGYAVSSRDVHSYDLVSCFVNMLPLAMEVLPYDTYIEFLERLKSNMAENTKNKNISLINIIKMLREKNISFNKLPFNVQLIQTTSISFALNLQKIKARTIHIKNFEVQPGVDLAIRFDYFRKQILIEFEYARTFSMSEFIQQLTKSFKLIISTLIETPEIKIKDIPIIDQGDKKKLLTDWNQAFREDLVANTTIHRLFEEQVERTPNNIAVICQKTKLTYKELNERANILSNYLIKFYDVKLGELIVLCLDRNENMLVSILAVLKMGAAYVPIDPGYPAERIKYIIKDTKTALVLTNKVYEKKLKKICHQIYIEDSINVVGTSLTDELIANKSNKILSIDDEMLQKKLRDQPTHNPVRKITESDLAYVIYTSGTIGTPKGVMVEHNSYNLLIRIIKDLYFKNKYEINTYSITNYVFDIFGLEYGMPLLSGGTITIDTNKLALLDCSSYDFIQMTPSVCELILDNLVNTSHIKLLVGGENLSYGVLVKILGKAIDVINVYGPTETTIWSTSKFYSHKDICRISGVSIGTPLFNEKVYVLNSNLNLLPIGVAGELYIGGDGLARGYLNRPDLSAEKFLLNPYQTQEEKKKGKNSRIYKTGDLVRWLPNGDLEYIGRNDFQVKIRGHRIELEEVESVLSNYKGVRQCAVIPSKNSNGDNCLIGYYSSNDKLDEKGIIKHLKSKLPEYMIPNMLVHLTNLPLTINGKLDRASLPAPKIVNHNNYIPPRKAIEKQIAKIWSNLLKVQLIGVHDNFFRLGGDSLLAMRMVMIAQKKNINLEIHELYNANDLASLCVILAQKEVNKKPPLIKVFKCMKAPLSLFQQEVWSLTKENARIFNIPIVLNLFGNLNIKALERALNILLQKHSSLRTIFIEKNNTIYQVINKHKFVPLKIVNFEEVEKKDNLIDMFIKKSINKKFNLKKDLLIRVILIKKNKNEYILVLVLHHIIIDGWSIDIIIRELCYNYNNYSNNSESLREIHEDNQYKSFSLKQPEQVQLLLSKIPIDEAKNFLLAVRNNIIELKKINNDPTRKFFTSKQSIQKIIHLDSFVIKQFAVEQKTTAGTVILSIFKCILHNFTTQSYINVSFPVTTRPTYKEQNTIGYFVNTFIIGTIFYKNITFKEVLEQVKTRIEFAKKYQNIPFRYLVKHLRKKQLLSSNCNIMFVNQNINKEEYTFNNLDVNELRYMNRILLHDIVLELHESENKLILSLKFKKSLLNSMIIDQINNINHSIRKAIEYEDTQVNHL